jgi:hypothetical protein
VYLKFFFFSLVTVLLLDLAFSLAISLLFSFKNSLSLVDRSATLSSNGRNETAAEQNAITKRPIDTGGREQRHNLFGFEKKDFRSSVRRPL